MTTTPAPTCGARHYDYPETLCTEPPRHRLPHAGPLIIGGQECGGAAWGPDEGYAGQPETFLPWAETIDTADGGQTIRIPAQAPDGTETEALLLDQAGAALLRDMLDGLLDGAGHQRASSGTADLRQRLHAALRARGEGDSDHGTGSECGDQTAAVLAPELAELADYRSRIAWETTCGACSRTLDSAYEETARREQAEAALERVRAVADQLEEWAESALKVADRKLYEAIGRGLRQAIGGQAGRAAVAPS